jgi:replicative superfamily II helicase
MLAVETLAQHRFPPGMVEALKADGVRHLLEHQVEAVKHFGLLGEQDLLVALPTSCGIRSIEEPRRKVKSSIL